jgi:amino acid adenylation domain-containing protein
VSRLAAVGPAEQALVQTWAGSVAADALGGFSGVGELVGCGVDAGAVAVSCGGEWLSYGELDVRVNRLARWLIGVGVGAETVVGVALERGVDLVVVLLAIWRAGGAYLPLDPDYPRDRLDFMVEDAGVAVVVGSSALASSFTGCGLVLLDDPVTVAGIAALPGGPLVTVTHPDQLAYVIYTSGSTGRPKGVAVGHRGVVNRLLRMQEVWRLSAGERVLHKTPLTFDASVWELFWPLMVGAELVVAEAGRQRDLDYLVGLLGSARISVVHFVPSLFRVLVNAVDLPELPDLRLVFCSGEALSGDDVARFYARNGRATIGNLYGPTEGSIEVASAAIERGLVGAPPIGVPVGNVRLSVRDRSLSGVGVGVAGELFIGGVAPARGYVRRPELTAERFVADPAGGGGRVYRTGDRVRWAADGRLEFLGRVDFQVKVRGVRIEPGEVEAAVLAHPLVTDVVVVAVGGDADRRLVAYVVALREPVATGELRMFLRRTLPDYLMPAVFVWVPAIPLSPNGKTDRAALPAPDPHRGTSDSSYEPPQNPIQENLAAVWAETLGLERVGVTDNFFELGGDSILSIQVVSRARRLGIDLTAEQLFTHQTIAELAFHTGQRLDAA